jgi:hypothetical protein
MRITLRTPFVLATLLLTLTAACVFPPAPRAAQVESLDFGTAGIYDGTARITRNAAGQLVFHDADFPTSLTLNQLAANNTVHAQLSGLLADDHPQYLTPARHLDAHTAAVNAALPLPPDLNGNTTLAGHLTDAEQHLHRTLPETIAAPWQFAQPPQFAAGLHSAGPLSIAPPIGHDAVTSFTATFAQPHISLGLTPTQATSLAHGTPAGAAWSNPAAALASDSVWTKSSPIDRTQWLIVTGFCAAPATALPAGAAISGIEIHALVGTLDATAIVDDAVQLVIGGVIQGANRASATHVTSTPTGASRTWGGPTDCFALTLTPAQLNAADFGVALAFRPAPGNTSAIAQLESITLDIHYTVPIHQFWALGVSTADQRFILAPGASLTAPPALWAAPATRTIGIGALLQLDTQTTAPTVVNGALVNIQGTLHWGQNNTWHPLSPSD